MKNKPDPVDSSLRETMTARIEIKELGDPAHQKKIEQAIRSTGTTIKAAATDTEGAHLDLPTPTSLEQAPVENADHGNQS